MKSSEILREAARLIERGIEEFSCKAVARALGIYKGRDVTPYWRVEPVVLRTPAIAAYSVLWERPPSSCDFADEITQEGRDERVIALCLAAAIAESEGQ